ncbi:helix-turn-helix transcriptional regulator [Clostridium intestinale]|uniref:HD domain-containing protein n=1 Tax=Clostridium intestinale TaxID=36845 RepID=A0A7D6VUT7_9CLOT|nr:helix-turn-helix transcriptional regulator [Clostridium intestinale]QLY81577.1 HD domain-containing protein [Clostridium intestinale]
MKPRDHIVNSLKYIKENLTESLSSENIAKNAGYSLYYFSRLFKTHVGLSVMEYVTERRLIKASEEIINGHKILKVSLDYGYNSHNGFAKAFKKRFGFSPSLLRAFSFQINYSKGDNYCMNQLFMQTTELHSTKEELYDLLIKSLNNNKVKYDLKLLKKAYDFACIAHKDEKRYSGDDYVTHPLNVAILLSEMNGSEDAIIYGLLHDIKFFSFEQIKLEFSERIADIAQKIANFNNSIEDEDVVMVKLADRLHNMRTIEFIGKPRWLEKAKETLNTFLPIASKLKNEKLISELNNLSVKYI